MSDIDLVEIDDNLDIDGNTDKPSIMTFQPDKEIEQYIKQLEKKWWTKNRSHIIRRIIKEHMKHMSENQHMNTVNLS